MGRNDAINRIRQMTDAKPTPGKKSEERTWRNTSLNQNVHEVECKRGTVNPQGTEGWNCRINGEGSGYRNTPISFHELEMSGAEVERFRGRDGSEVVRFDYPSSVKCSVKHNAHQDPEHERVLVCPRR